MAFEILPGDTVPAPFADDGTLDGQRYEMVHLCCKVLSNREEGRAGGNAGRWKERERETMRPAERKPRRFGQRIPKQTEKKKRAQRSSRILLARWVGGDGKGAEDKSG